MKILHHAKSSEIAKSAAKNVAFFIKASIFKKRRRQLAIMRICGCTPLRAWGICLGECCVVCVPVFLLGMATFIPFMHSFLSDIFIYMENSYSPAIYAAIFIIYMVMLLVIMGMKLLIQINRALSEAQKKGVG